MTKRVIPENWIRDYVDTLLKAAASLGPETAMGKATLLRADHAMDLVKAWREKNEKAYPSI